MLASYAVKNSKGREYAEQEDFSRTPFQRDRDRIIHSKAFRRLSGKTQVFVATNGDHFRDRLSHTLEMTQVARDIARTLHLNEDLAEAIALAHDLGHTPFGHAGEEILDEIMQKFGRSFEHNEQSKRIVEILEDRYPDFHGLNLTREVRDGLAKHQTFYDRRGQVISGKTLEAQVVDLADEIAYHNHDVDDGFRGKLFSIENLRKLKLWKRAEILVKKRYRGKISFKYLRHRGVSAMIGLMIQDVCSQTLRNIKKLKIRNPADALKQPKNLVSFSSAFQKEVGELRAFLWKKMYRSPKVIKHSQNGQKVLAFLFWKFYKEPNFLPEKLRVKIRKGETKEMVVKDYVAGMTDAFAVTLFRRL